MGRSGREGRKLSHRDRLPRAKDRAPRNLGGARRALLRAFVALTAGCILAAALSGAAYPAPDPSAAAGKPLVFLTEAANPPYAYMTPTGTIVGFEVELMNAVCARMQRACVFKHKDFERLVPALQSGKGDAIVSSFENTDERRRNFLLSETYFHMPVVLVARKDGMPLAVTPEALAGRKIGALHDSHFAALAKSRFPNSPLAVYDSQIDANLDLAASRIDLVIGDEKGLRAWLKDAPEAGCCSIAGRVRHPGGLAGAGYAVVMRKDEAPLQEKIDAALKDMRADGSYGVLWHKYFIFDPPQS